MGLKNVFVTLTVGLILGHVADVAAATVKYRPGGSLATADFEGELIVHEEGWQGDVRSKDYYRLPDAKTGKLGWKAKGKHGVEVSCSTTVRQEGDAVRVRARVTSLRDAKPECVTFSFNFAAAKFAGWSWTAVTPKGPRRGVIPEKLGKTGLCDRTVSSFALVSPAGMKAYEWRFPEPRRILLQDSRRWGDKLTLRIGSKPATFAKGTEIPIDFTLGGEGGMALETVSPCVVRAGADWIPLDCRKSVVEGSALDFSHMGFWDAPAGKHGWLKNANGDFEFEKTPGVKRKFYGVNLCFTANVPSHELADELIVRLKRLGYNTIRIHHHEKAISRNRLKGEFGFDPEGIDRFDYLFAKGVAAGFYFTTDVFVSREVLWEDIGLKDRGRQFEKSHYKALVALWDPAFENWKAFAKDFFEHVNPYTGRAYKDEPALPLISLINEGQLTMAWNRGAKEDPIVDAAYRKWLADRRAKDPAYRPEAPAHAAGLSAYGETGAVLADFMADVERRSASRMKAYLRALGVKGLVTNANCGPHPMTMNDVRAKLYDYTDDHFYVDHPRFLDKRWRLPSACGNKNPVLDEKLPFLGCAFTRVAGEPMCITEWNFSGPGMYRGVGGIMTGAFAALQDWSGLWRFAYSHSERDLRADEPAAPGYFNVATDALGLMGDRASICLFLRGDLPAAKASYAFEADAAALADKGPKMFLSRPAAWADAAWYARVAMTVPGASVPEGTVRLPASATHRADRAPFACEPNPAFRLDRAAGTFTIDTPRTSGGFTPLGKMDCGRVSFEASDAPATVWASAVDAGATDIVTARRLAVFHLTDIQADGNTYVDETKKILLKWGKAPSVVRKGSARIWIRLAEPAAYDVWSLRTDGSRLEKLTGEVEGGRLGFTASVAGPEGARLVYEVVRREGGK